MAAGAEYPIYFPNIILNISYQRFFPSHCCSFGKLVVAILELFNGDEFFWIWFEGKERFNRIYVWSHTMSDKEIKSILWNNLYNSFAMP